MRTPADELTNILQKKQLSCVFQPILDVRRQAVLGYEALVRGPSDSPLHSPIRLFDVATQHNALPELDNLCLETVIRKRCDLRLPGRLFPILTLSVAAIECDEGAPRVDAQSLAQYLAPLKARAKARPGNVVEIGQYENLAA